MNRNLYKYGWRLLLALLLSAWSIGNITILRILSPALRYMAVAGLVIMFIIIISKLTELMKHIYVAITCYLDMLSIEKLTGGIIGLMIGVMLGGISYHPFASIKGLGNYLTLGIFVFCGFFGMRIGIRRAADFHRLIFSGIANKDNKPEQISRYNVLDTSAIIDGRIYDVCLSKFIEGPLIVPTFVIEELQHIADSCDHIRRSKGRRGLELLSKMQQHPHIRIDIMDTDILEEKEVDAKLIGLCKQINANIITNDYNLNKVAELQGIQVLNINELTNAVKVMVYPGETMHISIIKEGKEHGQGVGYLEDGTMVVVEDAKVEIGRDVEVVVTSVFQTAAGRMIFTRKLKSDITGNINNGLQTIQEVNFYD